MTTPEMYTTVETKTNQINHLQTAIYCAACSTTWSNAGMRHSPFLSELHPACGFLPVTDRRSQFAFCLSVTPPVKLISTMESAGVNQTCHTIRAEITAEIRAAIPFSEVTADATYDCLLSETVIVGNVPESYLEFGSGDTVPTKPGF